MEVVDMKAELLKNHYRIQSSLMNVNTRLEEEIMKQKAELTEIKSRNKSLEEEVKYLQDNRYKGLQDCEGNLIAPNSC